MHDLPVQSDFIPFDSENTETLPVLDPVVEQSPPCETEQHYQRRLNRRPPSCYN